MTVDKLNELIDNIRGAVMICYPMGLPPWDNVRIWLEDDQNQGTNAVGLILDLDLIG